MIKRTTIDETINRSIALALAPYGDYFEHDTKKKMLIKKYDEYVLSIKIDTNIAGIGIDLPTKDFAAICRCEFSIEFGNFRKWRKKNLGNNSRIVRGMPTKKWQTCLIRFSKDQIRDGEMYANMTYDQAVRFSISNDFIIMEKSPELNSDFILDLIAKAEEIRTYPYYALLANNYNDPYVAICDWRMYQNDFEKAIHDVDASIEGCNSALKDHPEHKTYLELKEILIGRKEAYARINSQVNKKN